MKPGLRHILPWLVLAAACCVPARRAGVERPVPEPAPVRVRLLFAGDVMQHLPQVTAARRGDGFDYRGVFACLRGRFRSADLVVVNLETTLTRTDRYTGYPCFRSPVALADALRDAGVDVAVLANNHCCDGSAAGVHTTVAELRRCGILHTGVFTDSLDRAANNPLWVERYGVRFALLNYTYGTNGIPVPAGVEVNLIDTARMAADLAAARRGAPDCVAVCIHWGNEYERRENAVQRHLAQFLRRHGTDLVVGSHPHVVQPFDADSSHVVLYSLGNFRVQPAAALLRRRVGGRNRSRAASRRAHVLFARGGARLGGDAGLPRRPARSRGHDGASGSLCAVPGRRGGGAFGGL